MSSASLRNQSVTLALLYSIAVGPLEYSHADFLGSPGSSKQSIARHDCGARELHKNLSDQDFCVPCYRVTTSVANLDFCSTIPPPVIRTRVPSGNKILRVEDLRIQVLKRGPPVPQTA